MGLWRVEEKQELLFLPGESIVKPHSKEYYEDRAATNTND